jgi:hypothetical protein
MCLQGGYDLNEKKRTLAIPRISDRVAHTQQHNITKAGGEATKDVSKGAFKCLWPAKRGDEVASRGHRTREFALSTTAGQHRLPHCSAHISRRPQK